MSAGPADARVILVEYFDPGCETCRVFAGFVKGLLAAYPTKVRLVLRYAPFHQGADMMVAILEAARRQNRYWETLQVMYDTQPQWASHHRPQPERIWELLPAAGVDVDRIRQDIQLPEILDLVRQDMQDAQTLGVRRTPAFFVNGKPLTNFGHAQLKDLVESEIASQYGP
jgi:protein-disulfide isomerase